MYSDDMNMNDDDIYSDDMNDVLDDINNYNKNRDKKVLIVFDEMIADIKYNKNFKRIIKELFYRAHKINVSTVFIMQSYFRALKDARLDEAGKKINKFYQEKSMYHNELKHELERNLEIIKERDDIFSDIVRHTRKDESKKQININVLNRDIERLNNLNEEHLNKEYKYKKDNKIDNKIK